MSFFSVADRDQRILEVYSWSVEEQRARSIMMRCSADGCSFAEHVMLFVMESTVIAGFQMIPVKYLVPFSQRKMF